MSGQWEVVGKKKERSKKALPIEANSKSYKKTSNFMNDVKLAEILPKSQVNSIYSNVVKNKEKDDKPTKAKNHETKKSENKTTKPQEPPKPKPPKSIESAFSMVNDQEFDLIYERSRTHYPTAPIVWLKDLTQFLNAKIPVEIHDPFFSSKHEDYPISLAPSKIKSIIDRSVQEAGKSNSQLYFDIALTSMVTDLSKGLPATGYRFYLQHIARSEPKLVADNISKHVTLRNSYQNRPSIALALLWAVGQIGVTDQESGLKVFKELMLPLVEMKHYSQYVIKYLLDLINHSSNTVLSIEDYLLILDSVYSNKKIPNGLQKQVYESHPKIEKLLLNNSKDKYSNFVETFLKKIALKDDKMYQDCLCDSLLSVILEDPGLLEVLKKHYVKNISPSAVFLKYIENNVQKIRNSVNFSVLDSFFIFVEEINNDLLSKTRRDVGLHDTISSIQNIRSQLTKKTFKSHSITSKVIRLTIIAVIIAIIVETLVKSNHGQFQNSSLGTINDFIVTVATQMNDRFKEEYPEYYESIVVASGPYVDLARGLGQIFVNLAERVKESTSVSVNEKYTQVIAYVDNEYPGLTSRIYDNCHKVQATVSEQFNGSVQFIHRHLPVDKLYLENVQPIVTKMTNITFQKMNEYYEWVSHTVESIAK